jgi:CheY-like chemotaxis protein
MPALKIRPPTVLVVEDDALIRLVATELVDDLGFAVFEVSSADEAFAMLELHEEITIVFTDIHMPGSMNGLELAELTHQRWPAIGFVIVSGEHCAETGHMPPGAHFFSKPYNPEIISATLLHMTSKAAGSAQAAGQRA